jgi:cyclopropane-fatty-acyl-phospholipid synthase
MMLDTEKICHRLSVTGLLFRAIASVMDKVDIGGLVLSLPNGLKHEALGVNSGPIGEIEVHHLRALRRWIVGGHIGFAESYMDGDWSSPDLQKVLDVALLNNESVGHGLPNWRFRAIINRLGHLMRRNTKAQAKRNIEAHYDLGNDFYEIWLDPSMTYSSALFDKCGIGLAEAQQRKYSAICDRMALCAGDRILEIGCGWGGLAEYAAQQRGAHVTGLTLSPAQLAYAQSRLDRAGLTKNADFFLRDYRDEVGHYDRIASIEMFEAVGQHYWPEYFATLRRCLKGGGRAALQIITIEDALFDRYRRGVDFVQKYIFPGGMLPSLNILRQLTEETGLHWVEHIRFGDSYAQTLRQWRSNFEESWSRIIQLERRHAFDERFRRMWRFYLTSCAACFRAGTTDVVQISLARTA